jgi:nucleoside-diphosphate-sugar epimerase
MRVFLAGATGAIGRPLVAQLRAEGHEVVGTTRSAERARALEAAGAEAVVLDAFDTPALRAAVLAARPDAVVHQLTALSAPLRPRHYADWIATTNRLRAEITPVLLEAARDAGADRFVCQSVSFVLAFEGPMVGDETAKDARDAPDPFGSVVRANLAMEEAVTSAGGVVLRYGYFWGPGTSIGRGGQQAEDLRRRRLPIVGTGDGRFSLVHVEDAARATVLALDHGAPGVYNVVDDEPAPQREWMPALAAAVGGPPPRRIPAWLARLVVGPFLPAMAEQQRGSTNAKANAELGWAPRYPSWRTGFTTPGALG